MYFLCDHYQWAESVHLEYWSESLRLSAFLFQLVMRVTTAKTFITMEAVEEVNYVDDDDALTCVKSRARNVALSCAICNIPFKNQVATSIRKISFPFFQLYIFSKPIFYQTYFLCLWNLLDSWPGWLTSHFDAALKDAGGRSTRLSGFKILSPLQMDSKQAFKHSNFTLAFLSLRIMHERGE